MVDEEGRAWEDELEMDRVWEEDREVDPGVTPKPPLPALKGREEMHGGAQLSELKK